jgi:hypothetical protein
MTKSQFDNCVINFEFQELFRLNGWDNFNCNEKIEMQNDVYTLTGVAHKRGFSILQVASLNGDIPDLAARKQLEKKIKTYYHDHLLVFANAEKTKSF